MIIQSLRIISTIRNLCKAKLVIALHDLVYLIILQVNKGWFIEVTGRNNIQIVGVMCNNLYITSQFAVKHESCYHNSLSPFATEPVTHTEENVHEVIWSWMFILNMAVTDAKLFRLNPLKCFLSLQFWLTLCSSTRHRYDLHVGASCRPGLFANMKPKKNSCSCR